MEQNRTRNRIFLYLLRTVLIVAGVAMTAFIFSNSLKNAEQSTQQSSGVVEFVQKVASAIAPDSEIANATGAAYDLLHSIIRNVAHFSEFCALGALYSWACLSFTFKKPWQVCPALAVATAAVTDECLQIFSDGRAFQFTDMLLDVSGGLIGIGVAIVCVWIGFGIYKRKKIKTQKAGLNAELAAGERKE